MDPAYYILENTYICLLHRDGVRGGGEDRVGTSKRLGTSLQLGDVQRLVNVLVGDKVVEEVHHVSGVVLDRAGRHERVHGGVTVGASVQGPGGAANLRCVDRRAGGRDWASAAKGCQPHHNLVRVGAAGGRRQPQVVGDVGDEVRAGVAAGGKPGVSQGNPFGARKVASDVKKKRGGEERLTSTSRWKG